VGFFASGAFGRRRLFRPQEVDVPQLARRTQRDRIGDRNRLNVNSFQRPRTPGTCLGLAAGQHTPGAPRRALHARGPGDRDPRGSLRPLGADRGPDAARTSGSLRSLLDRRPCRRSSTWCCVTAQAPPLIAKTRATTEMTRAGLSRLLRWVDPGIGVPLVTVGGARSPVPHASDPPPSRPAIQATRGARSLPHLSSRRLTERVDP
jgi:hypothetical protein